MGNTRELGLKWHGQEIDWEVGIYLIDGHRIAYDSKVAGYAWDLDTGKETYVRWNERNARKVGEDAEREIQLRRAIKRMK